MVLLHQLLARLYDRRMLGNAIYGTYFDALGLVEMTDTFGTTIRIDLIIQFTLIDCVIRAFGLADIAVDAFVGNDQCHELATKCF